MLTVKEWLKNKSGDAQFVPLKQSGQTGVIKANRIKDNQIFELGKNLGVAAFKHNEKRFLQRSSICFFWDDNIHVSIQLEIAEPFGHTQDSEEMQGIVSLESDIVILQINDLDTKKLSQIYKEQEANFIRYKESQGL